MAVFFSELYTLAICYSLNFCHIFASGPKFSQQRLLTIDAKTSKLCRPCSTNLFQKSKATEVSYLLALKQEALVISAEILYFCFGLDIKMKTGIKMQSFNPACL